MIFFLHFYFCLLLYFACVSYALSSSFRYDSIHFVLFRILFANFSIFDINKYIHTYSVRQLSCSTKLQYFGYQKFASMLILLTLNITGSRQRVFPLSHSFSLIIALTVATSMNNNTLFQSILFCHSFAGIL